MPLDSRFVLAPSLEMYFVDKDTGLPLTNGYVVFYEDIARNVPKPVYQIAGTPPNYQYNVLPNPSFLSGVGTFQDASGNDILPYYFPYDGTPDTTTGTIDLYYIEVYDMNGVLQFTREGWPNTVVDEIIQSTNITNFVGNSQFLAHNNIPAISNNNFIVNQVYQNVTQIADGGWTFERQNGNSVNTVSFAVFPSPVSSSGPSGNARYAVDITSNGGGPQAFQDLRLTYPNVNTFAFDGINPGIYNLYFEAISNVGSLPGVEVIIRKNFGTGGSASTETVQDTITIPGGTDFTKFNIPLSFGNNTGESIPSTDDNVQIVIRFPANTSFNVELTDFAITIGDAMLTGFPTQTGQEQLALALAGSNPVPNPNGNDLYLPIKLGLNGYYADHGEIGTIIARTDTRSFTSSVSTITNELLCDGTAYLGAGYSPLGIPYSRLQNVLYNTTSNIPVFGTGLSFATAYINTGTTSQIILATNSLGNVSVPTAGNSGFTVVAGVSGQPSPAYNFTGYTNGSTTWWAVGNLSGAVLNNQLSNQGLLEDSQVSGYTTAMISATQGANYYRNSPTTYMAFNGVGVTAASLAKAGFQGKYFEFANTATQYYMWFNISNETDPTGAPANATGTGIQVHLDSTMLAADVALIVSNVFSGNLVYYITALGGSSITPGHYWLFTAGSTSYYVWYQVNGVGTDPTVASDTGIKVQVLSTDSAAAVATKTMKAINMYQFATPNLQGVFLRGLDPNGIWDLDVLTRFSQTGYISPTSVGSFELDQIYDHLHPTQFSANGNSNKFLNPAGLNTPTFTTTGYAGGTESRPVNVNVNYAIKY